MPPPYTVDETACWLVPLSNTLNLLFPALQHIQQSACDCMSGRLQDWTTSFFQLLETFDDRSLQILRARGGEEGGGANFHFHIRGVGERDPCRLPMVISWMRAKLWSTLNKSRPENALHLPSQIRSAHYAGRTPPVCKSLCTNCLLTLSGRGQPAARTVQDKHSAVGFCASLSRNKHPEDI